MRLLPMLALSALTMGALPSSAYAQVQTPAPAAIAGAPKTTVQKISVHATVLSSAEN